jgi:hypothetical protein
LLRFLRSRPRLASTVVLAALVPMIALVAYWGLQVHAPARSRGEAVIEWVAFLGSMAACLWLLKAGAQLLDPSRPASAAAEKGSAVPAPPSEPRS